MDITSHQPYLDAIADDLNDRPRAVLGFLTPREVFTKLLNDDVALTGHLAAYAGLAPVTRRSGTSIRGEFPSRTGNKHLKRALFLSSVAALRSDPVSRAYYDRKRAEGKKHNAALICLSRRRCDVMFAMLRNQQPYRTSTPAAA